MHSTETAESALLESEERYRAVIGALEEGIVIHEADGTISSCNASACHILGLPQEQIVGRSPREPGWRAFREDGRPFEPESHPAAITLVTGQPCSQVVMGIEKPGGARVWISINSRPLCRPGKAEPYAAAVSFTDITRRKTAEEELRRRVVQQSVLADLGRHALEGTEVEVLMDEAVRRVAAVLGVEHCKIVDQAPRQPGLRLRAGIGWAAGADGRLEPVSLQRGTARLSGLSVPIPDSGRPWGVLGAHTRADRDFHPEDAQFLQAVANVLAVAVERHRDQEAVRASEARHRALVEALPDHIFRIRHDGTYLDIKSGRPRELFASPRRFLGKKVADVLPPEVAARAMESLERALAGGDIQVMEYDLPRRGETRSYEARVVRSGRDEALAVVRDITPRRRSEGEQAELQEKIRKSATEWRLTFDAINKPVLLLELDGRVIRLNETARELMGVASWDEVLYRPLSALAFAEAEPWRTIQALLPRVETTFAGATEQTHDEQGRTWDVSLSPVISPDGQKGVVAVARDITDLVRLQESLRRSETMSAMGALVAGVAHEVRNPLFGISATLDAFASRFKRRTEYRRYLDILQGEVGRLSELMQTLLDYGKPVRLVVAPERPEEVMRAAVAACSPLAAKAGVEIAEAADPGLPPLIMDRDRIVQVFQNLLENAVQHSRPGDRVLFRAEAEQDGEKEGIRFTVEDSGPGFQPGDLDHVFEPFFTRRRGGTGMGLSIVQRIVEQHEGEIAAGNRPEGGATVAVTLPQWRKV